MPAMISFCQFGAGRIGAIVGPALAVELVRIYVGAIFSGAERHRRRLEKIQQFENDFGKPLENR